MKTAEYEKMLLDKKRSVLAGLGLKVSDISTMGRVADEDQAQASHDEFISTHLNSLEYRQLRLVEEALDRIQSGDYGICSSCEERIPVKRLKALPWARYCVDCQQRVSAGQDTQSPTAVRPEFQSNW